MPRQVGTRKADLADEREPEIVADPEVLEIIRKQNRFDLELYQVGEERWTASFQQVQAATRTVGVR